MIHQVRHFFQDLNQSRTLALWLLAVVGRLALATTSFTVLLLGANDLGGPVAAGVLSATFGISLVFTTPLRCLFADRYGRRALVALSLLFGAVLTLLALTASLHAPLPLALIFSALAGASTPPWGPVMKSQLSRALTDQSSKRTAFAVDSASEDIVYASGPAIGALMTSAWTAPAALGMVAALSATIALLLSVVPRAAAPEPRAAPPRRVTAAPRHSGIFSVLAPAFAVGTVLGAVEILAPSRVDAVSAGAALSALAAGSAIASVAFAATRYRRARLEHSLGALILTGLLSLSVTVVALPASSTTTTIVTYFALGMLIGPTVTTLYLAVDSKTGGSAVSAGWVNAMLNGGTATATALVGIAIGASVGITLVVGGIATAGLLLVLLGVRAERSKKRPRTIPES